MNKMRPSELEIEADPRAQCYRDLHSALFKFQASKTMTTAYILLGDFNEEYDSKKVLKSLFAGIVEFSKLMHLDDAMLAAHGGVHRTKMY